MLASVPAFSQISMEKVSGGILIKEGPNPVMFYQSEPKSIAGKFERNNYIHPLWGIDGEVLTEDFPADHLHQRGIFWAWHQILINGESIADSWELKNFYQEVTDEEFSKTKEGNVVLNTDVLWKSPLWNKDGAGQPFARENTTITIFPKSGNSRRIDFSIQLWALEEGVAIGGSDDEKGYGGFSARIKLPGGVRFLSEAGSIEPQNTPVVAGNYINIEGPYCKNGKQGGILIAGNRDNPGFPQPWILRKEKSMQNPVFPGRQPARLLTSEPLTLKYSLVIYKGKLSSKIREQAERGF